MSTDNGTEAPATELAQTPVETAEAVETVETASEPARSPYPFWGALGGAERAGGILPCGKCGTVHAEPLVEGFAHLHDALRRSAADAGWDTDEDGTWCCADCLDIASGPEPADWADGPGTGTYEQRLAQQVAVMAEIDADLKAAKPVIHAAAEAGLHAISLRVADVMARVEQARNATPAEATEVAA
jgi:hypothetical protein